MYLVGTSGDGDGGGVSDVLRFRWRNSCTRLARRKYGSVQQFNAAIRHRGERRGVTEGLLLSCLTAAGQEGMSGACWDGDRGSRRVRGMVMQKASCY